MLSIVSKYVRRTACIFLIAHGVLLGSDPIDLIFSDAVNKYIRPVIATEIISSDVPEKIISNYKTKKYRAALVDLHRIRKLNLPDGREDIYIFLSAECYFQLGLSGKAGENYRVINKYHPDSKFSAEVLFRSIQIFHETHDLENILKRFEDLRARFPGHKLLPAAAYVYAKSLIEKRRYSRAMEILADIKPESEFSSSSDFLYALCLLWTGREDEGIDSLNALADRSRDKILSDECYLTIGRVYHKKEEYGRALEFYSRIKASSPRASLASLKKAMVYLSQEKFKKAISQARPILREKSMFFEASLILQEAYWELKDSTNASIIRSKLVLQAKLTRLIILTKEEKLFIEQLKRQWNALASRPAQTVKHKKNLGAMNKDVQAKLDKIILKLSEVHAGLSKYRSFDEPLSTGGVLEKKLLDYYKTELTLLERRMEGVKLQYLQSKGITQPFEEGKEPPPNPHRVLLDSLTAEQSHITGIIDELYKLNQDLMKQNQGLAEAQPKFIDVGMILYERLKSRFHNANKTIRIYSNKRDSLLVIQNKKQDGSE